MEYDKHLKLGEDGDEIILGRSSWQDGVDRSLKYAWRDKIGRRARGGEIPIYALRAAVRFAASQDYLSRDETAALIKDLVETLVDSRDAATSAGLAP